MPYDEKTLKIQSQFEALIHHSIKEIGHEITARMIIRATRKLHITFDELKNAFEGERLNWAQGYGEHDGEGY